MQPSLPGTSEYKYERTSNEHATLLRREISLSIIYITSHIKEVLLHVTELLNENFTYLARSRIIK